MSAFVSRRVGSVVGSMLGAMILAGCATTSAPVPAGAPVHRFFVDSLVVRGIAEATSAGATCENVTATAQPLLVEMPADTRATILLGPERGDTLPLSILHIRHLESNRTWCVMTSPDGTPPALADEFPQGMYAMNVTAVSDAQEPHRYAISLGKL